MGITCRVCGKPLTGGLDTYGLVGEEVCLKHYFEPREPKQERQLADVQSDIEALESANEEIESEIQSLGWDLAANEGQLTKLYDKRDQLLGIDNQQRKRSVLLKIGA